MNISIFRISLTITVLTAAIGCSSPGRVVLGDERADVYMPLLEGKRVALLSNHSGIVGDKVFNWCLEGGGQVTEATAGVPFGQPSDTAKPVTYGPHIVDVLVEKGVNVTAIFSPEHGFRGMADAGELVNSSVDPSTGIPILSLYEKGADRPGEGSMDLFDVLVVDIQDVGLRYYTYYITMQDLMGACAAAGKKVVILDRPNPNGFYVDGPILDMKYKSGIGSIPVAMVHGMTLGELAMMMNGEGWLEGGLKCDLTVVPCLNYTHETRCTLVVPPSPNLKDMRSVYLYSSTCFFEGTIVTAGRGTSWPFEIYGYPEMNDRGFSFTPRSIPGAKRPRYMDQVCQGVDLRGKSLSEIWEKGADPSYIVDAFHNVPDSLDFFTAGGHFELLAGVPWVREMVLSGAGADEIKARWAPDVEKFRKIRKPYLIYPE